MLRVRACRPSPLSSPFPIQHTSARSMSIPWTCWSSRPMGRCSPDMFTGPCSSVSKRRQSWQQCCRWTVCARKTTCGWSRWRLSKRTGSRRSTTANTPGPVLANQQSFFTTGARFLPAARATQVLVDRLGITTEQAPPYAPAAKGTVEALFTWVTRKFTHRLPGTTKATPADRGTYDSESAAHKAGITLDVLEKLFIQSIVDAYMQEWDHLRRGRRATLWEESVQHKGVARYLGSPDDLKLLLMKAKNRRNPITGRYAITQGKLSFLGRTYVSPGLLDRLRGKEIDIYYDRRDISVIYLFLAGELVGEAYCTELLGQRMSIWEAQTRRKTETEQARAASTISLENRQRIRAA